MVDAPASPSLAERLRSIGISESYASQLVNGRRQPSLHLALKIHDALEVKMGPLKNASASDIRTLARLASKASADVPEQPSAAA